MSKNNLLKFPLAKSARGMLTMIQSANVKAAVKLPFVIKKVLVMKGMKASDVRGKHAHKKTRQILFCVNGSCRVDLFDGQKKWSVKLDKINEGVVLEPYVWHTMSYFATNTVLLVLADTEYDERDYIRDYDQFLRLVKVIISK